MTVLISEFCSEEEYKDVPSWMRITSVSFIPQLFLDYNYRIHSEKMDTRKKMLKPVVRGDGKRYNSINEAAADNGVKQASLSQHLIGRTKSSGGYTWRYE